MKKFLLPENGNFYKVNLHTHSNISDGALSPEELKKAYMDMGYSAVAFTDHNVFITHNDLTDENFVALNGYELDISDWTPNKENHHFRSRTTHICLVALSPDTTHPVCCHRSLYLFGNAVHYANKVDYDENSPDFIREYTPKCINEIIKQGVDAGFFVTYNHPTWSGETFEQYMKYDGMNAMEIFNNECFYLGIEEFNARVYDDMLRSGKKLYCIATDDTHNLFTMGGGYVVVKAEQLDYKSISSALLNGNFYSSLGIDVKELYVEDGFLCVKTSPCKFISLSTRWMTQRVCRDINGELTEAKFKLEPDFDFVRLTISDGKGKYAYTNAYSVEELLK